MQLGILEYQSLIIFTGILDALAQGHSPSLPQVQTFTLFAPRCRTLIIGVSGFSMSRITNSLFAFGFYHWQKNAIPIDG